MAGMGQDIIFTPDAPSREFFAAVEEGRLVFGRCAGCGNTLLGARQCDCCQSTKFASYVASGKGRVLSYTRVHLAHNPLFALSTPYLSGLIGTREGPTLLMRIVHSSSADPLGAEGEIRFLPFGTIRSCPIFYTND